MRRSVLLTMAALGVVLSLLGVGLYAALTDTARTGTNSAETAALAVASDLKLATATNGAEAYECGEFSDDLTTGLYGVSNVTRTYLDFRPLCLRNDGSKPVTVTYRVDGLVDEDLACTGDEALVDSTCGASQVGEIAGLLIRSVSTRGGCDYASSGGGSGGLPDPLSTQITGSLGTLQPGQTVCVATLLYYSGLASDTQVQAAQSDRATWRFAFTGTAS